MKPSSHEPLPCALCGPPQRLWSSTTCSQAPADRQRELDRQAVCSPPRQLPSPPQNPLNARPSVDKYPYIDRARIRRTSDHNCNSIAKQSPVTRAIDFAKPLKLPELSTSVISLYDPCLIPRPSLLLAVPSVQPLSTRSNKRRLTSSMFSSPAFMFSSSSTNEVFFLSANEECFLSANDARVQEDSVVDVLLAYVSTVFLASLVGLLVSVATVSHRRRQSCQLSSCYYSSCRSRQRGEVGLRPPGARRLRCEIANALGRRF